MLKSSIGALFLSHGAVEIFAMRVADASLMLLMVFMACSFRFGSVFVLDYVVFWKGDLTMGAAFAIGRVMSAKSKLLDGVTCPYFLKMPELCVAGMESNMIDRRYCCGDYQGCPIFDVHKKGRTQLTSGSGCSYSRFR